MSVFEGQVLNRTIAVAKAHHIEPEALLAVVDVESAGKSLENDHYTPCFLFERHIFYRELNKRRPELISIAVAQGLANKSWEPATQYKDQGTSAKRLQLLARARSLDTEAADRSCSWGVGQTMGFLAEELKFANAVTMLAYMEKGGIPAQVECMIREIENKKLGPKLNSHDWAGFARIYNGSGYKRNAYDTKMASAWARWKAQGINTNVPPPGPVVVPPVVTPDGPVKPPPGPIKTGGLAAIIAAIAAAWASFRANTELHYIIFVAFIIVLGIITGIVLWNRKRNIKPSTGTLATVNQEA